MEITPGIESLVNLAIMEDYSSGDATTEALIPSDQAGHATIVSDEDGVLSGIDLALFVFRKFDKTLSTNTLVDDGSELTKGTRIAEINGSLGSILTAERTALNFLRKLSGVATETSKYVAAVKGTHLNLQIGFSHDVNYLIPEGVKISVEKQTIIKIHGTDKQLVGSVAAKIKSYKKTEPYKGKGIKEQGQYIIRKESKKK